MKKLLTPTLFAAFVIILLGFTGIIISKSLPTNMESTLFMGEEEMRELKTFKKIFGDHNQILLIINAANQEDSIIKVLPDNFKDELLVFTPYARQKNKTSILINIPSMPYHDFLKNFDQLRFQLDKHFKDWGAAGQLWTNYNLAKENALIRDKIFPIVFITIGILLLLFLKNLALTIFIFLLSLSCTGYSFLLIKLLKNEVHLLTTIIPLMNFVIPMAIVFHLLYALMHLKNWDDTWKVKKKPILLASLTTIAGVASLYFSSISVIRDFALLGSLTLSLSFIITLIVIYLLKDILRLHLAQKTLPLFPFKQISSSKFNVIIFAITLAFIIFGFYFIKKIPVLVAAEKFFPPQHMVNHGLDLAVKTIGGIPLNEWIIEKDTHIADARLTYEDLKLIDQLLIQISKKHSQFELISPLELIKKANLQYTSSYTLPDFELSARTLYGRIPPLLKMHSWQEQMLKVTVLGKPDSAIESLNQDIQKNLPRGFILKNSGEYSHITNSQKKLIQSLIMSFIFSFLVSTIVVSFYLKSFNLICSFILVNLAPVAITLLLFPIFSMQLNMATIMSFSISFGLIVDGTIHLLFAHNHKDEEQLVTIKSPILISNIVIICGFLLLVFHDFKPIWQFGLSLALILILGVIYDLYLLEKITPPRKTDIL